jgi:hypothetical protein
MTDEQKELFQLRFLVEQMSRTVSAMRPVHCAVMEYFGGIQDAKELNALRRVLFDHWSDQEGNLTHFDFRRYTPSESASLSSVDERDQLKANCRSWREVAEGRMNEIERLLNRVAELEAELNQLKPNTVVDDIADRVKAVNAEPGVRM